MRRSGYTAKELTLAIAAVLACAFVLPMVRTSLGIGHSNLEVVFKVTGADGRPLSDAVVTLAEVREDPAATVQSLDLRTDAKGQTRHDFGPVSMVSATNLFGQEVDLSYSIPWWEFRVSKNGQGELLPLPLSIYCREHGLQPERTADGHARLTIPVCLNTAD